jgi:peptidoglycan/LPS O-acetylase OafA/YrhL
LQHLNSLRGIAALLVVFYHVKDLIIDLIPTPLFTIISASYLAVDFFFILSGFILCWKYFDSFNNTEFKTNFSLFIKKRIVRIYPLHLVILLAYCIIPILLFITGREASNRFPSDMIIPHLLLIQDWGMFSDVGWNVPSWSISAEFLAYLTFPFATLFILKAPRVLSIIALWSVYLALIFMYSSLNATSIGNFIASLGWLRCLTGFYFGMSVYFVLKLNDKTRFIVVLLACLFVIVSISYKLPNFYYVNVLFAVLLLLTIEYKKIFVLFLDNRMLHFLGDISYSLYMTHYLIRDLMVMFLLSNGEKANWGWFIAYVCITIIVSVQTYKIVEVKIKNKLLNKFI